MLARKEQESNSENNGAVCPESTIESANMRNPAQRPAERRSGNLVCKSTIESANRRSFIKKAALITAAASVAGTVLGSKILRESSAATPAIVTCGCNLQVIACTVVDSNGHNGGGISTFFGANYALTFGAPQVCCIGGF